MARAIITRRHQEDPYTIEDIQDLSMQPPYWMVKRADGRREFLSFHSVEGVIVEGEEELMKAAQAHVGDPIKLSNDLGLEA